MKSDSLKLVKSINKLLDIVNILSAEMECRARNIDEIRALLKQADVEYSIIVNCIRNGANYNNKNSKSAVEDYANNLRVAVLKFLEIDERESLLDKQENELMSRVNALLAKLSNITAKDNKAQEYEEMFVSEIEGNEQFSLLREECSQRYDEIVFALRKRIKQLRQEENSLKLVAFKNDVCIRVLLLLTVLDYRFNSIYRDIRAIFAQFDTSVSIRNSKYTVSTLFVNLKPTIVLAW